MPTLTDSGGQGHCSELDRYIRENPTNTCYIYYGPNVVLSYTDSRCRQLEDSESTVAGLHYHLGYDVSPGSQRRGIGNWEEQLEIISLVKCGMVEVWLYVK